MYTSMCLQDFNDFKKGEIFDTYQRTNYAYLRKENSSDSDFFQIPSLDYKNYFEIVDEYISVPIMKKMKKYVFFRKVEYEEKFHESYKFDLETKYLRRIQREIFLPIYLIKDEEFLLQFSDTINYVLSSLEEITKMYKIADVALEAEITRAAEYFNELEVLYNNIDESAQIDVTELLGKHHDHMNRIIMLMKEFNKA